MFKRSAFPALLLLPLLGGCGQVMVFGHVVGERSAAAPAKPDEPAKVPAMTTVAATSTAPTTQQVKVKAVNLTLSPSAASEVAGDSTFAMNLLLEAINAEMRSRGLLEANSPGTAEIVIDHLATHPMVNAVVFGRRMLTGTLTGTLRAQSGEPNESPEFTLVAESRLSIPVDGSDQNPLGPLYRRFAVLAADRLAGVESKPVNISADGQPRS